MIQTEFDKLNPKELEEFLLSSLSVAKFTETYFKNPDEPDEPLELELGQVKAINAIQFGYDIEEMSQPPPRIPKGIIMIWPRQFGKTTGVAAAVAAILIMQKGVKIGVMGMSEDSSLELLERIVSFIENSPFKDMIQGKPLKTEVKMIHGGRCKAHTTSQSIRGKSYHYLVLDEAARIDDEIIEAAMYTTRKVGLRWIMLSTPAGYRGQLVFKYTEGLKTRPVVCKECDQEYHQTDFVGVTFSAFKIPREIPNCIECGSNDYRYGVGTYSVIAVDPFSSSFYSEGEIKRQLKEAGNTPLARQEILGEIIPEGQLIFQKEWIDKCTKEKLKNTMDRNEKEYYCVGADFGKIHDASVFVVTHVNEKNNHIVIDYIRYMDTQFESEVLEYKDIRRDCLEIISYYDPGWLIPDSTGIGDPIMEQIEEDLQKLDVSTQIYSNKSHRVGFVFDMKSKPDLIEYLQSMFAKGMIDMPPQTEPAIDRLVEELLYFSYKITQSDYIKYGVQTHHDDGLVALALSCWGHRTRPWATPGFAFSLPRGEF